MSIELNIPESTFYSALTRALRDYEGPDLFLGKSPYSVETDPQKHQFFICCRYARGLSTVLKGRLITTDAGTVIRFSSPVGKLLLLITIPVMLGSLSELNTGQVGRSAYVLLLAGWMIYRTLLIYRAKWECQKKVAQAAS